MINKEELLEKIEKERQIWLGYYSDIAMHLYAIAGVCFRAGATFKEDTTKVVLKDSILEAIHNCYVSIEEDTECLDDIYSIILNSYEPVREFITQELSNIPEAENKGIEIAKITPEEALTKIENELIARQNISNESLIRLQTLQWIKDIIEEDKKEA